MEKPEHDAGGGHKDQDGGEVGTTCREESGDEQADVRGRKVSALLRQFLGVLVPIQIARKPARSLRIIVRRRLMV